MRIVIYIEEMKKIGKNTSTQADFVNSPRKLEKLEKMLNYGHLKKNENMIKFFAKIKKSILIACFAFLKKMKK